MLCDGLLVRKATAKSCRRPRTKHRRDTYHIGYIRFFEMVLAAPGAENYGLQAAARPNRRESQVGHAKLHEFNNLWVHKLRETAFHEFMSR